MAWTGDEMMGDSENKKSLIVLLAIFSLMYVCNSLSPVAYGDDYLYSFVWAGQPMMVPLPEDARRVASFYDLFVSQWSHYMTWGGRAPAHLLVQFFRWQGKTLFDVCNSLMVVLLVMEIYYLSDGGRVGMKFRASRLAFIFFCLWSFTIGFGSVYLWCSGSCNYLWTAVLILAFLMPYVRFFLSGDVEKSPALMMTMGLFSGWTNENDVCWIILLLGAWLLQMKRQGESAPSWMTAGVTGLLAGYVLLMLAPGNFSRIAAESERLAIAPFAWRALNCFKMMGIALTFQLLLWFFVMSALRRPAHSWGDLPVKKPLTLIKCLCFLDIASGLIMMIPPDMSPRTFFHGLVFLVTASVMTIKLQEESGRNRIEPAARRMLLCVGILYFAVTATFTVVSCIDLSRYDAKMMRLVADEKKAPSGEVLVTGSYDEPDLIYRLSGFHTVTVKVPPEADAWQNVAFSRYYGIAGIRGES